MYNLSVWKENVKLGKFYDYSDFELHGTSSDFIKKKMPINCSDSE